LAQLSRGKAGSGRWRSVKHRAQAIGIAHRPLENFLDFGIKLNFRAVIPTVGPSDATEMGAVGVFYVHHYDISFFLKLPRLRRGLE
jgi:hypothetical protein